MKSCLLRRAAASSSPTVADLVSSFRGKAPVPVTPFSLRRDTLPPSFVSEHLPVGWVPLAESWCDDVLGASLKKACAHQSVLAAPRVTPHEPFKKDAFDEMASHHHLFLKCLIAGSYLPKDLDSRTRGLVVPPQALLVTGLNVLKLTANTLSLYGGEVPSEGSLVSLLPMERMDAVATRWRLGDVALFDYAAQRKAIAGEKAAALPALPPRLIPSVVVQIIGAMSLVYGPSVAGDFAIAEIFPPKQRQPPSAAPIVFM